MIMLLWQGNWSVIPILAKIRSQLKYQLYYGWRSPTWPHWPLQPPEAMLSMTQKNCQVSKFVVFWYQDFQWAKSRSDLTGRGRKTLKKRNQDLTGIFRGSGVVVWDQRSRIKERICTGSSKPIGVGMTNIIQACWHKRGLLDGMTRIVKAR